MEVRIHSFAPIVRCDAKILILGTMPSETSLRDAFYYAHPRNCFWPMMAEIFGTPNPTTQSEKRTLLMTHRIALWDVAQSCVRPGSLDVDIRDAQPNDIGALLRECPQIGLVLLNGGTAMRLFRKLLPEISGMCLCKQMPSTSPAYTLPSTKKRIAWEAAVREMIHPEMEG